MSLFRRLINISIGRRIRKCTNMPLARRFSTLDNRKETYMFIGCYTRKMAHATGLGKGMSVYKFDTTNGNLKYQASIPEKICGINPSAFYINSNINHVYICNEYGDQSSLTGIQYDPNKNFEIINHFTQKAYGDDPCLTICDDKHNFLYSADYAADGKPSVSIYKLDTKGFLTPFTKDLITEPGTNAIPSRQATAHIHCVMPCKQLSDPLAFYVNDLGRDTMYHYGMNGDNGELKVLSQLKFKDGDGPRHLSYHPKGVINGKGILYMNLEMGSAISVVNFDYKTNELLNVVQTVTSLPSDVVNDAGSVYTTSHILCDRTGRYVYCANRGHDSIVRYVIDNETGLLDESIDAAWYKCGGKIPRHFEIDPTNNYLIVANQEGAPFDNISVFKIDHNENGALQFVQSIQSGSPSFIQFVEMP